MTQAALANAELAVMQLLWEGRSLTARTIREKLYPDAHRAQHGTVQRLLQRLEDKGFVERDRAVAVHLFCATVSRQAYASGQLESLAERLTGGSLAPIITHLLKEKKIPRPELRRLRDLLNGNTNRGPIPWPACGAPENTGEGQDR